MKRAHSRNRASTAFQGQLPHLVRLQLFPKYALVSAGAADLNRGQDVTSIWFRALGWLRILGRASIGGRAPSNHSYEDREAKTNKRDRLPQGACRNLQRRR